MEKLKFLILICLIVGIVSISFLIKRRQQPHTAFENGDFETGKLMPWSKTDGGEVGLISSMSRSGNHAVKLSQLGEVVGITQNFTPLNIKTLSFYCKKTREDEFGTSIPILIIKGDREEILKAYDCSNTDWSYVTFDLSDIPSISSIKIMIDGAEGTMDIVYDDIVLSTNSASIQELEPL